MSDQIFRSTSPLVATRVVASRLHVSTAAVLNACEALGVRGMRSPTGRVLYSLQECQQIERHFNARER